MGDWTNGTIDTVNGLSDTLADTIAHLETITSSGENILDVLADGINQLEKSLREIAVASGIGADGLDALSGSISHLRSSLQEARAGLAKIRKALGDLSNSVEIDDANLYIAMELLTAGVGQLTNALEQCGEAMTSISEILQDGNLTPEERTLILQALNELSSSFQSVASAVSRMLDGVTALIGGVDWEQVKESADQVIKDLGSFFDNSGSLEQSMRELQDAFRLFSNTASSLKGGISSLSDAMNIFEGGARELGDMFGDIHDLFEDLSKREPVKLDKLGENFHQAEDNLHASVTSIGDHMELLRGELDASSDAAISDLIGIVNQFQAIAEVINDAISEGQGSAQEERGEDVSEELIDSSTLGKAKNCVSHGSVEGDLNIGGITGAMAIEYDLDPEDDVDKVGEKSLNFRYETRAILQSCVNCGAVASKKDAAGGVVGRMDLGYLWKCENYGTVDTMDGNYTGGIAGISNSIIRNCWSKCRLSGGSYVGGIAGYGREIYQCVSLVAVAQANGYSGSIAGDWDRGNGALGQNRFVDGTLAGVDGISYAGQAEPVAYGELVQDDAIPSSFRHMTVTYAANGETLETVSYAYGDSFLAEKAPEIPQREGYYGTWESLGENVITVDHILKAVYTPLITTLGSDAMRSETRAAILMEGTFDETAVLFAELQEERDDYERWAVTLTDGNVSESHILRYALPETWDSAAVSLIYGENVGTTIVDVISEGSYLVFSASGTHFTIEVQKTTSDFPFWVWFLIAGLFVLFVIAVLIIHKKRVKKMEKSGK